MCGGLRSPSGLCLCSSQSGRRTATDPSEVQPGPRKSDRSKSWAVLHRTSAPYVLSTSGQLRGRCASRCSSHLGWGHFCQCGGPMYDREVRSGNSRRKERNKGGTTTRRPSLALLDPLLMNFRARVFRHHSPCRAAVRTCSAAMELTYKAIRLACTPPTAVISAPGFLMGSGMGTRLRGFLHAEPLAGAAHWSAHVEVQRWRS